MLNKIFQSRFTPFIVVSALFALYIGYEFFIDKGGSGGWGYAAAFVLSICVVVMMVIDMFCWYLVSRENKKWVWLGELAAIILFILYVKFS